ncbi:MAG: hypothetical protein ACT4RN_19545 [Pseudonocardia sp.]
MKPTRAWRELDRRAAWVARSGRLDRAKTSEFVALVDAADSAEDLPAWARATIAELEEWHAAYRAGVRTAISEAAPFISAIDPAEQQRLRELRLGGRTTAELPVWARELISSARSR